MTRQWKPGDVAIVSRVDGIDTRAICVAGRGCGHGVVPHWHTESGGYLIDRDARPVVVIDPEDIPVAKGRLAPTWLRSLADEVRRDDRTISTALENVLLFLAAKIDETNAPEKPAEPQGLGAVVEDAEGERWVRSHTQFPQTPWTLPGTSGCRRYDDIPAVKVLSEGVTA